MGKPTFFVFCRPRSRSAWLANFLTHGNTSFCLHEALMGCSSIDALRIKLLQLPATVVGAADPGLIHYSADILAAFPTAKLLLLHSDGHAWKLFARANQVPSNVVERIDEDFRKTAALFAAMDIAKRSEQLTVDDLDGEGCLRALWRFFVQDQLGVSPHAPFPEQRFRMLRTMRVHEDTQAITELAARHIEFGGLVPPAIG